MPPAPSSGTPYTPFEYIQMFFDIETIELRNASGDVVSTGTILDYLKWKSQNAPNGTTVSLDSEATHLGDKGIAKQIEAYLQKAYPKIDFDTNSWRVFYKRGIRGIHRTMENWSCTFQRGTDLVSMPSIEIVPPEIS